MFVIGFGTLILPKRVQQILSRYHWSLGKLAKQKVKDCHQVIHKFANDTIFPTSVELVPDNVCVYVCVCVCVCVCVHANDQICLKFVTLNAWVNPLGCFFHCLKILIF